MSQILWSWIAFLASIGAITALVMVVGDYYHWLLGALFLSGILLMIYFRRREPREISQAEAAATSNDTVPEIPEPRAISETEAHSAQSKGEMTMRTSDIINTRPGDTPHPLAFMFFFIVLAVLDFYLWRILFQGFVPTAAIALPNGFGTVTPDDLVPLGAFLVYCIQIGMYRWRPGGVLFGILDLLISAVPAIIIGAAIVSWTELFDFAKVHQPAATRSHYAALVVFWAGFFTALDILLHTFKFAPRTVVATSTSVAAPAEPMLMPATGAWPDGYAVMPLKPDEELTYLPKRNVRVVSAA